jgi:NAD(P)-dependent dehydrogenase (short-subunit alcohol dehydrogenase family)
MIMNYIGCTVELCNAVALLCSEEASWITGQLLSVDGGSSMMDPGLPLALQLG